LLLFLASGGDDVQDGEYGERRRRRRESHGTDDTLSLLHIHKSISQLLFSGLICSRIVLLATTQEAARCSKRSSSLINENMFSRDPS